jgi:hypothetical protein
MQSSAHRELYGLRRIEQRVLWLRAPDGKVLWSGCAAPPRRVDSNTVRLLSRPIAVQRSLSSVCLTVSCGATHRNKELARWKMIEWE